MKAKTIFLGALLTLALVIGLGLYFSEEVRAACQFCPTQGQMDDTGPCFKKNGRGYTSQFWRCSASCYGCQFGSGACNCIVLYCNSQTPGNPICLGSGADSYTDYCENCGLYLCPCDYY